MKRIGNTLIINADTPETLPEKIENLSIITCGLSYKATITASSISDSGFNYCIQRSIFTESHNKLLEQEIPIHWYKKPEEIYGHLEFVTALLLCDTKAEAFNTIIL